MYTQIRVGKPSIIIMIIRTLFLILICSLTAASYKALLFFVIMSILVGLLRIHVSKAVYIVWEILYTDIYLFMMVFLVQLSLNASLKSIGFKNIMISMLITLCIMLLLYGLSNSISVALAGILVLYLSLATINAYVYAFKGSQFRPLDILASGTLLNVIDKYDIFPIPVTVVYAWSIGIILLSMYFAVITNDGKISSVRVKFKRIICIICAIVLLIYPLHYVNELPVYHWKDQGTHFVGYILDFVSNIKSLYVPKPDDYNNTDAQILINRYEEESKENTVNKMPHIIVIMDESFADFDNIGGNLVSDNNILPFISNMKENTIKGYAASSVFGGSTANSEYEFLTGNSLAWFPNSSIPYEQYLNENNSFSIVDELNKQGYTSIAMHPYEDSGWNRPNVYQYMGFKESLFIEDFPQKNIIREYVSDQEMFEKIINTYQMHIQDNSNPLFVFGVTMQNHGGYEYTGPNYNRQIIIDELQSDYPAVEQYLNLINQTDKAVKYLIEYFEKVDDDVVVVFFGDHFPGIYKNYYETLYGKTFDTLDEQILMYQIPYFIWTNYDIKEENMKQYTSLNYLSSYLWEVAGLDSFGYMEFLKDLRSIIPAINSLGYYSKEQGGFIAFDNAYGIEAEWLDKYEMLQYHNVFGLDK